MNPRKEIEIEVNEVMDNRQEPLAIEEHDLWNEESDEEEIIREMKNVKKSTLRKDQVRMIYGTSRNQEMRWRRKW